MSSNYIDPYKDGFRTKRDFHRVYERVKRTSDEKVMVVRSWHSRAHSLLSSAKGGQLSLTQLIPAELGHTQLIPAELDHTRLVPTELSQKSSALRKEDSSSRRGQLGQKSSALPKEVSSSSQRGQLIQKSSVVPKEVSSSMKAQLSPKRSNHPSKEVRSSKIAQLYPKRSAHPREFNSAQRSQLGHSSSFQTLPSKKIITWVVEVRVG